MQHRFATEILQLILSCRNGATINKIILFPNMESSFRSVSEPVNFYEMVFFILGRPQLGYHKQCQILKLTIGQIIKKVTEYL